MNSIHIFQIAVAGGVPAFALWFHRRTKIGWLSPIVICYGIGIAIGNIPGLGMSEDLNKSLTEFTVPLAIPLLLLSTDLKAFLKNARKTTLSFALGLISVIIAAGAAGWFFADQSRESAQMAGMLVGVYTGGSPNMAAIAIALEAKEETFLLLNAADILCSAIYLLFLTSIGKAVYRIFLPAYTPVGNAEASTDSDEKIAVSTGKTLVNLFLLALFAAGTVGISAGLSWLITGSLGVAVLILFLTALSIGASFIPPLRNIPGSYNFGQFLLLVFSVSMGLLSDFSELMGSGSVALLFTVAMFGTAIVLHLLLAMIFRIDADTLMITSTAAIFGPVFIGQVADSIRNRELIFSGMAAGLVGYAVGNFLGIGLYYLLS